MPPAPTPQHENRRLEALHSCNVLETDPDPAFDQITRLAAELLEVPFCVVSLVAEDKLWFKSCVEADVTEIPREHGFCGYTILGTESVVIEDTTKDERSADSPFVTGEPHLRAYAGHPLILSSGDAIGTLCVLDTKPHCFSERNLSVLRSLAEQVVKLIELHRERLATREANDEARSLRSALEHHVLYGAFDRAGTIIDANEGFCQAAGHTREELLGQTQQEICSGIHPDSFWTNMWESINAGKPWRAEICNRSKDGSLYWVDTTYIPTVGQNGVIEKHISLGFDITIKKLAESENLLLSAAFERFPDAAVITDLRGNVLNANDAAARLNRGLGAERTIGAPSVLLSSCRADPGVMRDLLAAVSRSEQFATRTPVRPGHDARAPSPEPRGLSDASVRWLDISATPIQDHVGEIASALIIMRDVTAEIERERDASQRTRGAEARARISAILSGNDPLDNRLKRAIEVSLEMCDLDAHHKGGLFTLDDGDGRLRLRTHVGSFTHEFLLDESAHGPGICVRAALSRELIVSDECSQDDPHERSSENAIEHGQYTIPLLANEACVGVLFLQADVNPPKSEARLEALRQIGQLFANTLITERSAQVIETTTRRLQEAQVRFELALEGSRDAIFDWDIPAGTVYFSSRWTELLRCTERNLTPAISSLFEHIDPADLARVEESLFAFVDSGGDHCELEFRLVAEGGTPVWGLFRAAAIRDDEGRAIRITGSIADISTIKSAEEQVRLMVQQDQLTGLASRSKLMDRLKHALARTGRSGAMCGLLFFDFDRFKVVNDSLGHDVGDELLCSIASRLQSAIRGVDLAARLGGDEFVVLLEDLADSDAARRVADKLLTVCAEPHVIRGHSLVSTASIGLVTSEHSSGSAAEMLRDADAAMYTAKANGRGRVVEFDQAMHDSMLERLAIEADLRVALEHRAFELHYQPIVNLESGEPVGAEALMRWTHPKRGPVSPGVFIPIAEESNLIHEMGSWVIDEACAQILNWKTRAVMPDGFRVSINVSKAQLLSPDFVEGLIKRVHEHGLQPADLKLEVTETTIVDNRAGVSSVLDELRRSGFVVMMDDFGTGHSSLSGLHTLPIDELKIDQSFIRHDDASREIIAITSSIVTLADQLSLRTVGEGIETIQQIALLQNLGCHYGQGYYFSKPVPPEQLEEWIRLHLHRRAA